MKLLSNENKGALYCIISGLLYGLIGYFGFQIMNENISAWNMLFWRFLAASIFIIIILLPKIRTLNIELSRLIGPLICVGLFYGIESGLYFVSTRYIGTGLSMVIFFTYPLIVILGNWILYKEKISRIYYLAVVLIMIGMSCLVDLHEVALDLFGIALALLSALGYAGYIMVSKKQIGDLSSMISTLLVCVGSCITSLVIAIFDNSFVVITSLDIWYNMIGLAIICTAVPILFLLEGLKYISSSKASILSVLEPVCVFIIGVSVLGEKVTLTQTLGVIIILTGALIVQFDKVIGKYK